MNVKQSVAAFLAGCAVIGGMWLYNAFYYWQPNIRKNNQISTEAINRNVEEIKRAWRYADSLEDGPWRDSIKSIRYWTVLTVAQAKQNNLDSIALAEQHQKHIDSMRVVDSLRQLASQQDSVPAEPVYLEWNLLDMNSALSLTKPANSLGSELATNANASLSIITGTPTGYGVRSEITNSANWVEHDVILDKAMPGRTYRISGYYRYTSGNTAKVAGGIFSWGSVWPADNSTAVRYFTPTPNGWQPYELFLRQYDTNGTLDFNLYSNYQSNFPGTNGEGIEHYGLHVTEVVPDLFTEPDDCATNKNYLVTTVEEQALTTGITLSGLTKTTRGFDSSDLTDRAWYQIKPIRSNNPMSELAGTGYIQMSTPSGALTVGERYKFTAQVGKATGATAVFDLANWTGVYETDVHTVAATEDFEIVTVYFTASATTVACRLDVTGTVYTSGWRMEHYSDLARTNIYGTYVGSADAPNSTSVTPFGWQGYNTGVYSVETTNTYRGGTAIKVTGSAANSYIGTELPLADTPNGVTYRLTGRYYVESIGGTQRILMYNSGGTPSYLLLSFNTTYIGRWVWFELEFPKTNAAQELAIEISGGTGVVYVDDLRLVNLSENLVPAGAPPTDPILELTPTAYFTPASIDPAVTVDGNALSTWNDVSGNGFHATPIGAINLNLGSTGRQAEWAASTYFDVPDNAALDFNPQTDDVTIISRVGDGTVPTGSGYFVSKALPTSAQRVYGLYCGTAGTLTGAILGGVGISLSHAVPANALIITVISGGVMNVWVDGVQVVTNMASGTTAVLTGQSWNIGGRSDGGYLVATGYTCDLVAICIGTAATPAQRAAIEAEYQVN